MQLILGEIINLIPGNVTAMKDIVLNIG